jgi:uncharacterized protein YqiB (DUF1249 family)
VLADSYIVPQCSAAPRSLGALMALYEGNFIKLNGLAPGLLRAPAGESGLSRAARDLDLHLRVDAVTRYTVDLRLTYLFEEISGGQASGPTADPDLNLRLYLDARMVEVVSWSISHRHEVLRQLAASSARELDRRWSRNIMLGKWLDYLDDMGHAFRA